MNEKLQRIFRPLIIILVIYLVLLIGPVASLDIPSIATAAAKNPLQLIQFLIIGIANGAIMAIIALGYTLVYGIIELINFAHGDVVMVGTFTSLTVLSLTGTLDTKDPVHIILGLILALGFSHRGLRSSQRGRRTAGLSAPSQCPTPGASYLRHRHVIYY